jgi:tetratricopeptide (TPR) repeat protein
MPFVFSRLCAKTLFPLVFFACLTHAAYAATSDIESLLPEPSKDTAYLLPISQALTEGKFSDAETLVRARLSVAPEDAIAWEVLGVALALSGDANGADMAYAKAVELEPKRLSAWVKRGDLAEASGNMQDALTYWAAAIEIAPLYGAAHQRLGVAYADAGDLPRAIEHLEAAVAADDTARSAFRIELALVYNRAGRPNDALALFPDDGVFAQTDAPADMRVMLALGNAHAQMGDVDKALSLYQRGIDLAPEDIALLKAKGALLVETGDAEQAAALLSKPAAAEPVDAYSNAQYARALLALAKPTEAIAAAERAIGAGGAPDIARQAFSVVARAHLLNRDFPAAIETTSRLVSLMPDDPAAWREHAGIRGATGQYEAAKEIYDAAISRFDGDAELLRGRSIVKVRLGQLESAADDAVLASTAAPGWLEPRFLLGEVERARGRNEAAEEAFRSALVINPDHWPSLVNVASLRLAAGDAAEAVRLAQRAVEISGGAQAATEILATAQTQQ